MSDYNSTYKRKRSRKPITTEELMLRMTDAIGKLEEIIMTCDVREESSKIVNATNALSGAIGKFNKLYEVHHLEKRLERLEQLNNLKKVG